MLILRESLFCFDDQERDLALIIKVYNTLAKVSEKVNLQHSNNSKLIKKQFHTFGNRF